MSNEVLGVAMRKRLCSVVLPFAGRCADHELSRSPASDTIHPEAAVFDSDRDEVQSGCGLRELRS